MKKMIFLFSLCICYLSGCDEGEKMEYANIYFPLAARANTTNHVFEAKFDYSKDTTFIIGAYCAGSIITPDDVNVEIDLATDSLSRAQTINTSLREYNLLPDGSYTIIPSDMIARIKAGTERGDLSVTFHTSLLDPGKKYILPLYIKSVSRYEIAGKHSYLFFGITKQ